MLIIIYLVFHKVSGISMAVLIRFRIVIKTLSDVTFLARSFIITKFLKLTVSFMCWTSMTVSHTHTKLPSRTLSALGEVLGVERASADFKLIQSNKS